MLKLHLPRAARVAPRPPRRRLGVGRRRARRAHGVRPWRAPLTVAVAIAVAIADTVRRRLLHHLVHRHRLLLHLLPRLLALLALLARIVNIIKRDGWNPEAPRHHRRRHRRRLRRLLLIQLALVLVVVGVKQRHTTLLLIRPTPPLLRAAAGSVGLLRHGMAHRRPSLVAGGRAISVGMEPFHRRRHRPGGEPAVVREGLREGGEPPRGAASAREPLAARAREQAAARRVAVGVGARQRLFTQHAVRLVGSKQLVERRRLRLAPLRARAAPRRQRARRLRRLVRRLLPRERLLFLLHRSHQPRAAGARALAPPLLLRMRRRLRHDRAELRAPLPFLRDVQRARL